MRTDEFLQLIVNPLTFDTVELATRSVPLQPGAQVVFRHDIQLVDRVSVPR